ncbi:MAG TPA: hypothetical protein PL033_11490 [Candidatus Brocadiia bacterium]|nr:hypothetical protein [Candidatus Brocadiia bacterium]
MDLIAELEALCEGLTAGGVDFALCGGLAMAVHAFPRATLDIDVMIEPESLDRAKEIARGLGFAVDAGLMTFKGGAIRIHRMTKLAPESGSHLMLDMLLVTPLIRGVWESRQKVRWLKGDLPVVSPQGLIELKSLRGSGQDADDIVALRRAIDEG